MSLVVVSIIVNGRNSGPVNFIMKILIPNKPIFHSNFLKIITKKLSASGSKRLVLCGSKRFSGRMILIPLKLVKNILRFIK